jgi:hypothetical protein
MTPKVVQTKRITESGRGPAQPQAIAPRNRGTKTAKLRNTPKKKGVKIPHRITPYPTEPLGHEKMSQAAGTHYRLQPENSIYRVISLCEANKHETVKGLLPAW